VYTIFEFLVFSSIVRTDSLSCGKIPDLIPDNFLRFSDLLAKTDLFEIKIKQSAKCHLCENSPKHRQAL